MVLIVNYRYVVENNYKFNTHLKFYIVFKLKFLDFWLKKIKKIPDFVETWLEDKRTFKKTFLHKNLCEMSYLFLKWFFKLCGVLKSVFLTNFLLFNL